MEGKVFINKRTSEGYLVLSPTAILNREALCWCCIIGVYGHVKTGFSRFSYLKSLESDEDWEVYSSINEAKNSDGGMIATLLEFASLRD